jgi:hypothetical protein
MQYKTFKYNPRGFFNMIFGIDSEGFIKNIKDQGWVIEHTYMRFNLWGIPTEYHVCSRIQ